MRQPRRLFALALAALCCLSAARGAESPAGVGPFDPPAEVSSSPAPEESPSPAPEESPSPAPEESPSPAPEESPSPAPEESPSPAPEESPSPAPEESPSPAPEESPSPAPEESPSPAPEPPPSPSGPMHAPPRPTPTPEQELVIWMDTDPPLSDQPYLLPLGGSLIDVPPISYLVYFRTDSSDYLYFSYVGWGISQLDLDGDELAVRSPGLYTISGMPDLTDYFIFSEELEPLSFQLAVVQPDYVDLTAHFVDENGDVVCLLYCRPADPDSVTVLGSADGDSWTALSAGTDYTLEEDAIRFSAQALAQDVTYRYQVRYDRDGCSNVLSVRLTGEGLLLETDGDTGIPASGESAPTPAPTPTPTDNWGGDRDGSDWEDQDVPIPPSATPSGNVSQTESPAPSPQPTPVLSPSPAPSPTPSSEPTLLPSPARSEPAQTAPSVPEPSGGASPPPAGPSKAAATPEPQEFTTQNATALTGERLEQLAEHAPASTLLFEKAGVAVELPASFLTELGLEQREVLAVEVERPAEHTFRLTLLAEGAPVEDLPETTVRFPWTGGDPGELLCLHVESGQILPARYEAESGTVVCAIQAAGTYEIRLAEEAAPAAASPDSAPSVPPAPTPEAETPAGSGPTLWKVPAGGAAAVVLLLLWRKRHG